MPLAEYIVMLDLDWKRPAVLPQLQLAAKAMAHPDGYKVLTANSIQDSDYYDLWALRSSVLHIDYDCWFDRHVSSIRGNCDSYEVRIDASAPILPVNSSFNGLALYSVAALRGQAPRCRYDGERTCEHVSFHLCLRERGLRIGIAPFLIQGCGDGAPRCAVGPPATRVRVGVGGTVTSMHV